MPINNRQRSVVLIAVVAALGIGLAVWKRASLQPAAGMQAEMPEVVSAVAVKPRNYQPTTTSIGTVMALRSVALRNEVPGTVDFVALDSGRVVAAGAVLLRLDTKVEEAELKAQEAEAGLARAQLERTRQLVAKKAASVEGLEQAQSQYDVLQAQIARTRAVIARKVIRAPFRARIGIADVHVGQYLDQGTLLTTLQGVDEAVHIDFAVAQQVAAGLRADGTVEISGAKPIAARIVAIDARVDPKTRNTTVRARVDGGEGLTPGASVRVRIPSAPAETAFVVPSSALRRAPEGDHVFVIVTDPKGQPRAQLRRVHAGAVLGDEVVIQSGLKEGERIATTGSFKLRDQALVALAESAPVKPVAAQ